MPALAAVSCNLKQRTPETGLCCSQYIIAHRHRRQILTMVVEATDWLVAVTLWRQFRQPRRILVTAAEVSEARGDALLALVFSVVVELVGRLVVELAEGEVRGVVLE